MSDLKRILLVEDSANDAELTLIALGDSGLSNQIVWVKDGQEAIDYLYKKGAYVDRQDGHPVVVLLDLKLPKLDGLQVLERVKKDTDLKAVPVVMLTSSREEIDVARSYGLGVNAYVVKPVDFPEFVKSLRGLGLFWAVVNQPPPGSAPKGGPL